jgi:hypothetical protein
MRVYIESSREIVFSGQFNLDLSEFVLHSCSAFIEFIVYILNVKHYELS